MATKVEQVPQSRVFYHLVKRVNPVDPEAAPGVSPQVVYRGEKMLEDLCRDISERSLLCDSDVLQVVQAIVTNAVMRLMNSEAFTLGYMGYLSSELKTDLVEDPTAYKQSNIRKAHVVFHTSNKFRRSLAKTAFTQKNKGKVVVETPEE